MDQLYDFKIFRITTFVNILKDSNPLFFWGKNAQQQYISLTLNDCISKYQNSKLLYISGKTLQGCCTVRLLRAVILENLLVLFFQQYVATTHSWNQQNNSYNLEQLDFRKLVFLLQCISWKTLVSFIRYKCLMSHIMIQVIGGSFVCFK